MENVEQNRNEQNPQEYQRRKLLINAQMSKAAEIHAKIFEWVFVGIDLKSFLMIPTNFTHTIHFD